MPAGRPTVVTPEILAKLEEVFAIGGSDLEACHYANIGKTTLYNYQQDHPEFVERKEELKERPVLKARQTIIKALDNPQYALEYLKRKKKDEFSDRSEHTGANGEAIKVNIIAYAGDHDTPQLPTTIVPVEISSSASEVQDRSLPSPGGEVDDGVESTGSEDAAA